jgi:hypothetical protein
MKTKITTTVALLLLMLLASQSLRAGGDQYSRTVKREYNVNPDAQLVVDNRFGKIHCNNWDKNVISLEVTITVDASDEASASKIMDRVTFTLSGTADRVEARTMISEGGMKKNSNMTIDYTINMPASVNIDLTNRFGDIFVNEVNGKSRLVLSYGNIDVNKLSSDDNMVDIKFGNGNIKSINRAVVILKYSELEVGYAGNMRLDSKFSNLDASKIVAMNVNFEGGKLNTDNISTLDTKSKFSDLNIARLEKSLNLDIQYGNCDIEQMPADFTSINIVNRYADVNVGLPDNANYSLDADLKFCELDFPENRAHFTEKISDPTSKSYKAVIGKQSNSRVTVKSDYGNVSLHD